ncbi:MAG: C4-dicarboxylate TRAP transporter substrate-binding protein [Deltaproteobacteria bacterium]|nr:C4-dicarboxylate TRAP transporter substrate-binding protein [Deltaproteobacteria bacterium]
MKIFKTGMAVSFCLFLTFITPLMIERGNNAAAAPSEKPIVLKFASYFPEVNTISQANLWWAKEIEKRTNGRVTFEFYWAGSLVKAADLATATGRGICDVALLATGYTRAKFPITGIYEAVYITEKPDAACRAMSELFETNDVFNAEWRSNNLYLLFFDMLGPNIFGFKKKVEKLEDLRGLKIRTAGKMTDVTKRLGATAVSISSAEIYEGIDRGLIDGYTNTSLASAATRSFPEVAPFTLDPRMGNYACIETAMNLRTWNNLPPDIKDIMKQVSIEVLGKSLEIMVADENRVIEKMTTDWKATFYALSPDEAEKWKALVVPLYDGYIKDLEDKGLPGKELFNSYRALAGKYEKESPYSQIYDRWLKRYGK